MKPFTILSSGDWHLRWSKFEECNRAMDAFLNAAVTKRPDLIVIGGDLAGIRVPYEMTPKEMVWWQTRIQQLQQHAPVILLRGNHDNWEQFAVLGAGNKYNATHPVLGVEMVFTYKPREDIAILCIPYQFRVPGAEGTITEQQASQSADLLAQCARFREANPTVCRIILGHLPYQGCEASGGEVLAGHEVELTDDHLEAADPDMVLLHHIHKPQRPHELVAMVGSPYAITVDEQEEKSFTLLTLDALATDVTRIPTGALRPLKLTMDSTGAIISPPRDVAGRVVRLNVTYHEHQAAEAEARIAEAVRTFEATAASVEVVRRIEPSTKPRAAGISEVTSLEDKFRMWYATTPAREDATLLAECLEALRELQA